MKVYLLSDVHYGKKTRTFDTEKCKQRLKRYLSTVSNGDMILMLGDMVDGSRVFPSQITKIEVASVEEQCIELAEYISNLLAKKQVRVYGVPGNHGRVDGQHEFDNWDMVFYRYLSQLLDQEDIVPDSLVRIIDDEILITHHTDSFSVAGVVPWTSIISKVSRWAIGQNLKLVAIGHYHVCSIIRLDKVLVVVNGTLVSHDDWAFRKFGFYSNPEQVVIYEKGNTLGVNISKL